MRNKSKITTLESKFPLLSIEQGCMVSKDADITVAFRVELPELFTVTSTEYEAMHSAWHKAIKVLPNYSIVFCRGDGKEFGQFHTESHNDVSIFAHHTAQLYGE